MLNASFAKDIITSCITLQGQVSFLDAVLNIYFILIDHYKWLACRGELLGYPRTYTAKATYDTMITQSTDLPVHNAPPNCPAQMAFNHKFHECPKSIEERTHAQDTYYYRKQSHLIIKLWTFGVIEPTTTEGCFPGKMENLTQLLGIARGWGPIPFKEGEKPVEDGRKAWRGQASPLPVA